MSSSSPTIDTATTPVEMERSPSALDDLLSPTGTPMPHIQTFVRDSVAETEFGEVRLDEGRFSTVSLNTRDSMVAMKSPVEEGAPKAPWAEDGRRTTFAMGQTTSPSRDSIAQHKKSASAASARSSTRASFLLQRLEIQKDQDGQNGKAQRSSQDGRQKLQEEFDRIQNEKLEEASGGIDWAFWGNVMSDYSTFASQNADALARAIEKGIPDNLRGMMWQLMSASKDPEMESTYLRLLKETSPHEKAISRDLGRTFPHHAFFTDGQGIGQENLFNVLKAYSIYDPQVGYCQGLPFVVAVLLLNMPDEEAFCLLVRLMYSYDLRGHFLPDMPKLQLRLFQFDRLIEEMLPVLHVHFLRQGIKSSMFCSQWFLTLFSYRFPLEIVFRIFDNCLASGIEAIFGFSLSLLNKNEEKLLSLKFDEIVAFLNSNIVDTYKAETTDPDGKPIYRVDDFVQDAITLKITPFMLDSYIHEYNEMIRVRDAHVAEVDALRATNRKLSNQVNTLEASLAQLNQEHVDVLNELVRARLQNEEIEGELVRYKLLYAESVHQTEDAMSSHRLSTPSNRGSKRPSLTSLLSR